MFDIGGVEFHVGISLGDVMTTAVVSLGFAKTWFSYGWRLKNVEEDISDIKHGRGLIIEGGNWPDAVRRCFGYGRRSE